jgi:hypothetical protein
MHSVEQPYGDSRFESKERLDIAVVPPGVETLLSPDRKDSLWPENVAANDELRGQAERRRELIAHIETLFDSIPEETMDIRTAVDSHLISDANITAVYEQCSDFLESEDGGERIILYLPFELLPKGDWKPDSPALSQAIERFSKTYAETWRAMLSVHDVRANFVEGDILEQELRTEPLPRVSKAAHLIPILVQNDIISAGDAVRIARESDDEILRNSIADSLPVLADMNLLPEETLAEMEDSDDSLMRNLAIIIRNDREEGAGRLADARIHDASWLREEAAHQHKESDAIERARGERIKTAPKARADWEAFAANEEIVKRHAEDIAQALSDGSLAVSDIQELIATDESRITALSCIHGVRNAAEALSRTDSARARKLFQEFESTVEVLWKKDDVTIHAAIESMLSRLAVSDVVEPAYLGTHGLATPKLDGPFDVENKEMVGEFSNIAQAIESNTELLKYIFPVAILYGSKVKGYGARTADNDVAVFVRPDVPFDRRKDIQTMLEETLRGKNIKDTALEFWLEAQNGGLQIRDMENPDKSLADSSLVHVLFCGAWCGDRNVMRELYDSLLSNYLFTKEEGTDGTDRRNVWLEELERDTLQYRLMHKGYAHFYPEKGGLKMKHSEAIDSRSAFWDSGYRRLATKLYLKKVFFPKLSKVRV